MTNGNGHNGHKGNGRINNDGPPAPMSPEQFGNYIEKRLSIEDAIAVLDRKGMELRLKVKDAELTINLENFYVAYARDPTQLDIVVHNLVEVALGLLPDRTNSDFEELADRIYPMLKPIALLVAVRDHKLPMLAYQEFLADLIIAYVIDEERSVAFLNQDHLERWGVGINEIHRRAITNLHQRTIAQTNYVVAGEGDQRLFIFNSGDGYDATRLLLTDVLITWARQVPGNLVIGIPNRDFLIAFSDVNPDVLRGIALQIQADSAQREYGLTDQLFTFIGGRVQEYIWE